MTEPEIFKGESIINRIDRLTKDGGEDDFPFTNGEDYPDYALVGVLDDEEDYDPDLEEDEDW